MSTGEAAGDLLINWKGTPTSVVWIKAYWTFVFAFRGGLSCIFLHGLLFFLLNRLFSGLRVRLSVAWIARKLILNVNRATLNAGSLISLVFDVLVSPLDGVPDSLLLLRVRQERSLLG